MENTQNMCKCLHHKVTPVLVVLFGLTFLLGALDVVSPRFVMIVWPVLVIVAGLMKWAEKSGMCKCC